MTVALGAMCLTGRMLDFLLDIVLGVVIDLPLGVMLGWRDTQLPAKAPTLFAGSARSTLLARSRAATSKGGTMWWRLVDVVICAFAVLGVAVAIGMVHDLIKFPFKRKGDPGPH